MSEQKSFEVALAEYVANVQRITDEYFTKNYSNLISDKIAVEKGGRKYIKISQCTFGGEGSKSVHSFVNSENGDVLKPAGWNAPAKHARGNIYKDGGVSALSPRGNVLYL